MTREEKQKAIDVLKISAPVMAVTQEEFKDYIQTLNKIMNWLEQEPCDDCISRQAAIDELYKMLHDCFGADDEELDAVITTLNALPPVTPAEKVGQWIPVSERLPELNRPLLVTAYHRVYYGHLISESGNYGYPVFRIHGLGDKNRDWVQETMSHEPYSLGRIDAWMYFDIPEPYKASPTGAEEENE